MQKHTLNTHFLQISQPTPKMMNSRSKIRKTQFPLKYPYKQASRSEYDQESTESGALIGSNDDILTEILIRLPTESIVRFKSVSKHWLSLLSHRRFTLCYDKVLKSPGLFYDSSYIPFDGSEDKTSPPSRSLVDYDIQVVQSCNGLLFCRSWNCIPIYSVLNATTKQFTIIPPIRGRRKDRGLICFMGLAYHNADCVHFKVVCFRYANRPLDDLLHIQIYSSETGKWKILNESFSVPHYTFLRSGVYWKEAFHWIPSCLHPLYLNLKTEKLQKLPLPSPLPVRVASFGGYCNGMGPFYFGESGGHLHLVAGSHLENRLHLNIYEMLSDHSGWFVKYQVELDELPIAYPGMINSKEHPSSPDYYIFGVLDVVRGEEEKDTFMVVRIPNKIIRYNVIDKSFKQILDFTNTCSERIRYAQVHRYIKTLTLF